jgi:hypothetical protein
MGDEKQPVCIGLDDITQKLSGFGFRRLATTPTARFFINNEGVAASIHENTSVPNKKYKVIILVGFNVNEQDFRQYSPVMKDRINLVVSAAEQVSKNIPISYKYIFDSKPEAKILRWGLASYFDLPVNGSIDTVLKQQCQYLLKGMDEMKTILRQQTPSYILQQSKASQLYPKLAKQG